MSAIIDQARQKLADEVKKFSGGQKEKVVYKAVSETLQSFCVEEWFAKAILESTKTLSDCCRTILSDVSGGGISDLEVYKRAVEFYFPTATVKFKMEICMDDQSYLRGSDSGTDNEKIVSLFDLI